MPSPLFLLIDSLLTGLFLVVAYKLGQWGKNTVEEELGETQFLLSQVQRENHLLRDMLEVTPQEEEKVCDTCMDSKPLTQYHSHPTCKCCRKEYDAARYKAKKEVLV